MEQHAVHHVACEFSVHPDLDILQGTAKKSNFNIPKINFNLN